MALLDYIVLVAYFAVMTAIGLLSMLTVKKQEDFFLGSRTFGKLFQAFAAFGAGTGSHDPVAVGRTTFTSGLSGIWSVLLWLFVTPFYWFTAVWYRRMRHLTLGDWFVERYHGKALGAAYTLFSLGFYAVYLALGFTAIGKVGAPLINVEQVTLPGLGVDVPIAHVLVYVCALVVLVYGVLGGLRAAYWTDLIQGIFIILLSVLLIPAGLNALVEKDALEKGIDPETMSTLDGFRVMHEQVPAEYFEIIKTPVRGEFPFHYILGITLLNLVAIVVHPHMAATGGGSAKSENSARVGLVVGNFLKRFCTIGWCITVLIVLAYMADNVQIAEDPDQVWGVAAREILGPFNLGLVGLMLACLMAAMMSSASCYMLIVSALVVRNFYAAYINSSASERTYVLLGRIVSMLVIVGGVIVSVLYMDVLEQLKIAWEMPLLFASLFWVGMFWRRATKWAAWGTLLFSLFAFVVIPIALPMLVPSLGENQQYAVTNDIVTTTITRPAAPSDVAKRKGKIEVWGQQLVDWVDNRKGEGGRGKAEGPGPCPEPLLLRFDDAAEPGSTTELAEVNRRKAQIDAWYQKLLELQRQQLTDGDLKKLQDASPTRFGLCPPPYERGEAISQDFKAGGEPIYWKGSVQPVGQMRLKQLGQLKTEGNRTVLRQQYDCPLRCKGRFKVDFLLYDLLGLDMQRMNHAALETLRLPTRLILPFLVMILLSLVTPRVDSRQLDRFYVKMKTPVIPDPEADAAELEKSYADPSRFDDRRLFKFFSLEMQRPKPSDIFAFILCFAICFALIGLTVWVAKYGS